MEADAEDMLRESESSLTLVKLVDWGYVEEAGQAERDGEGERDVEGERAGEGEGDGEGEGEGEGEQAVATNDIASQAAASKQKSTDAERDTEDQPRVFTAKRWSRDSGCEERFLAITTGYLIVLEACQEEEGASLKGWARIREKRNLGKLSKITSRDKVAKNLVVFYFKPEGGRSSEAAGATATLELLPYVIDQKRECIALVSAKYKRLAAAQLGGK
jgi:hypothetical protein